MAYSPEACAEKHRSINWMFGTLISMQLMCFSWLGYLSMRVINLENNVAATQATLVTKLDGLQKQMDLRFDGLMMQLREQRNETALTKNH
jgi:hypothetical protein